MFTTYLTVVAVALLCQPCLSFQLEFHHVYHRRSHGGVGILGYVTVALMLVVLSTMAALLLYSRHAELEDAKNRRKERKEAASLADANQTYGSLSTNTPMVRLEPAYTTEKYRSPKWSRPGSASPSRTSVTSAWSAQVVGKKAPVPGRSVSPAPIAAGPQQQAAMLMQCDTPAPASSNSSTRNSMLTEGQQKAPVQFPRAVNPGGPGAGASRARQLSPLQTGVAGSDDEELVFTTEDIRVATRPLVTAH